MSKAERNALAVSYDALGARVELDLQFVKRYLVRGRSELVSDQEVVFFMNTCRAQGLNPLVNGEVYLIKYSKDDPAQMVVGKDAYLRRAFDNPSYLCKEDGITVKRGGAVVQKNGCCLYPGEELVGGWCKVTYERNGLERDTFKEVSLREYDRGQANWKSKPATMINKVAISQCVRDAFPKDYEGLYSEEEMCASGAIPVDYEEILADETAGGQRKADDRAVEDSVDPAVTHEQRKLLFKTAKDRLGDAANESVKLTLAELGLETTDGMRVSDFHSAMAKIDEMATETRYRKHLDEDDERDGRESPRLDQ
jgi:phage recombination protein Bet